MNEQATLHIVVVGHGGPGPAGDSTRRLVGELARRGTFAAVAPAFLRAAPCLDHVLAEVPDGARLVIVPHLAGAGYYADEVIPTAAAAHARRLAAVRVLAPLGLHPALPGHIAAHAAAIGAPDVLLIGHGSSRDSRPGKGARTLAAHLRGKPHIRAAHCLFLEEAPYLETWPSLDLARQVLVVPLFVGGGQHAAWDLPDAFGLAEWPSAGFTVMGRRMHVTMPLADAALTADLVVGEVQGRAVAA